MYYHLYPESGQPQNVFEASIIIITIVGWIKIRFTVIQMFKVLVRWGLDLSCDLELSHDHPRI